MSESKRKGGKSKSRKKKRVTDAETPHEDKNTGTDVGTSDSASTVMEIDPSPTQTSLRRSSRLAGTKRTSDQSSGDSTTHDRTGEIDDRHSAKKVKMDTTGPPIIESHLIGHHLRNRINQLPDDLTFYLADQFLNDYEAVYLTRTEKRTTKLLKRYNIKEAWNYQYAIKWNRQSRNDSTLRWRIGVVRQVGFGFDYSDYQDYDFRDWEYDDIIGERRDVTDRIDFISLASIPRTTHHITFQKSFITAIDKLSKLPPSIVSFGSPEDVKAWSWYVEIDETEYEQRKERQPIQLPESLRRFTMPTIRYTSSVTDDSDEELDDDDLFELEYQRRWDYPTRDKLESFQEVDPTNFISLPSQLTELGLTRSAFLHKLQLPSTLRTLKYDGRGGETHEWMLPILPHGLETLRLSGIAGPHRPEPILLPPTIKRIDLTDEKSTIVRIDTLFARPWPESLTELTFPYTFNQPLDDADALPPNLNSLDLKRTDFNHSLDRVTFPPNLIHFACDISHSMEHVTLPSKLTSLEIGGQRFQSKIPNHLPTSLTKMSLSSIGQEKFTLTNLPNLTSLRLPLNLDSHRLKHLVLPPSVTELEFGCGQANSLQQASLPPSLRRLTVDSKLAFSNVHWPSHLRDLHLRANVVDLRGWLPPPSLTRLTIGKWPYYYGSNDRVGTLGSDAIPLPPNLQHLTMRNADWMLDLPNAVAESIQWPRTLTHLTMKLYECTIPDGLLPETLLTLDLTWSIKEEWDSKQGKSVIAAGVSILPVRSFPSQLRRLFLACWSPLVIPSVVVPLLPPHLETLSIDAFHVNSGTPCLSTFPATLTSIWFDRPMQPNLGEWLRVIPDDSQDRIQFRFRSEEEEEWKRIRDTDLD